MKKKSQVIAVVESSNLDQEFWNFIDQLDGDGSKIAALVPKEKLKSFASKFFSFVSQLQDADRSEACRDSVDYNAWGAVASGVEGFQEVLKHLKRNKRNSLCDMEDYSNEDFMYGLQNALEEAGIEEY